ncbi:hypothetical protein E6C76_01530 [Pseudothauera nasutitermitis]|uniref:Phosphoglycerate mutase n=1 Tax=Pseudothauera nasutitermitis TaxID=2565930 RepID=A0A4S4B3F9_9RHOO|nr:hypothetical protein [Pseudothauera nasutitermitis]THF67095.1 hypothetical protein E6C76_01530 [Pseudothauera nasutitermitis]
MTLHLVLPGLLWPGAQTLAPAAGLALPALERLLGLARARRGTPADAQTWLLEAHGLDAARTSAAALRRLGETTLPGPAADDTWLCADPVNLRFAREHLILADAATLDITVEEAAALVGTLNESFADLGRFEAATAQRWYLRPATPPAARFVALHDAVGRPLARSLPQGEDAAHWQRAASEIQIVLHNHPVNRAREEAGQPLINSLWLWGAGRAPEHARPPAGQPRALHADGPFARGLASAAGYTATTPDLATALAQPTLAVLERLAQPAMHLDLEGWRAALAELERGWFAPLLDALRHGRLRQLTLVVPDERATLEFTLNARDPWKFWRRPLSLDALHKSLPTPEA